MPGMSPSPAVVSYTTVSPLPPGLSREAVYSLWHFPYPCGRWPLATSLLCGARTFLTRISPPATVYPGPVVNGHLSRTAVTRRLQRPARGS